MKNPAIILALTDPGALIAFAMKLKDRGYRPIAVKNGKEALARCKDSHAAAIVVPMLLPDMTGLEVLHQARDLEAPPFCILIADHKTPALSAHVDTVLSTRGGIEELVNVLDRRFAKPAPKKQVLRAAPWPDRGHLDAGSTARTDPARLVGAITRFGLTGCLQFDARDGVKRSIYFTAGQPVFGSSSAERERLGNLLVDRGIITRGELQIAVKAMAKGKKIGQILVDMGALTDTEVQAMFGEHVKNRMLACFQALDETYSFTDGSKPPVDPPDVLLRGLELIRLGVYAHYPDERIEQLLPSNTHLRRAAETNLIVAMAALNDAGRLVLGKVDPSLAVSGLLEGLSSPGATHKLLYALYAGGVLEEAASAS